MEHIKKHIDDLLILAFIFCLPFQRRHIFFNISPMLHGHFSDFLAISLYLSDLVSILLIIRLIYLAFNGFLIKKPLILAISLILILNLIFSLNVSRGNSSYIYYSFIKWIEFIGILGYFAIQRPNIKTLLVGFTVTGLFQGCIGLAQFIEQKSLGLKIFGEATLSRNLYGIAKIDTPFGKYIRAYGTFAHANQLSAFLIVACATSLALFFVLQIEKKYHAAQFSLAALFILIFLEFSTFSRAGLIAMFACFTIIFICTKVKGLEIKKPLIVACLAIFISVIAYKPFLFPRLTITDASTAERLYYDKIGIEIIEKHPVFGVGMGNLIPQTAVKIGDYDQAWEVQPAHDYF